MGNLARDAAPFQSFIDPDDESFANPPSMIKAIKEFCQKTGQKVPRNHMELIRCIFESLPLRYRQVFGYLQEMAPFPIECLHVIGGGSRNNLLNQNTCNAVGVPVWAGPSECTAIGNIMLQAKAAGDVNDITAMRAMIAASTDLAAFTPCDKETWDAAYDRYLSVYREDI